MIHLIGIEGRVRLLHYREQQLLRDYTVRNKIIWDGKEDLLNQFFCGTVTWSNFYMGLITTAFDFTLNQPSMASIVAKEFTNYDEGTRPEVQFEAADVSSDASYIFVRNSSANFCLYTISTGVVNNHVTGVFIAPISTKGGAITTAWCTAAFGNDDGSPEDVTVNAGDVLRIQYTARIPKA